jgi:hypothetical protein
MRNAIISGHRDKDLANSVNGSVKPRSAKDLFLLFLWILGYQLLIRFFAVLQRAERVLSPKPR